MNGNAVFFIAGLIAPLVLLIAVPHRWRQILAGFILFLYVLFAFAVVAPLLALLLVGLIPALIAQATERRFLLRWRYGMVLPIVALPHALLLLKKPDDA
jgi:hypothetical protein